MLDDFIELILELILDGAIEAAGSKRVPMPVRILLAAMIMALVFSVCGLFIYIGVDTGNAGLTVLGTAIVVVFIVLAIVKIRKYKKQAHRN